MAFQNRLLFFFVFIGLVVGCATAVKRDTRLYCMETGVVITGQIADARQTNGVINMFDPSTGETFTGEYTSIPGDSANLSYATSHWATAYGFSFNKPRMIYGEATLVGNAGTIIEIVYVVDRNTIHGTGVGRDNRGNRYKVHF